MSRVDIRAVPKGLSILTVDMMIWTLAKRVSLGNWVW